MLKATFCAICIVGEFGKVVHALLSIHALDIYFQIDHGTQFWPILHEENDLNPLTRMWCEVFGSPLFNHKLLEFIKLTEIINIQVFGYVEDEHTFNIVAFIKTKLRNYLTHT